MSVRRTTLLLVAWLIPTVAHPGHHKFGVFVAPSYLNAKGSNLDLLGWHVAGEVTFEGRRWLGLAADVSAHFWGLTDETGRETTQVSVMLGPRFTVPKEYLFHDLYGHVLLLGAVHRTETELLVNTTAGALAIGAGWDKGLGKSEYSAIRIQVDYLKPWSSDLGDGFRLSIGFAYRFPDSHDD
jgi:hypothetical protein